MQEIHSMGGGSRFFGGGGAGGGDRRLRPHSHHTQSNSHHHQAALKCPRCDSLNTKFCYYNNYNLSQPRHFCKNCRRYWTKGGVLRNVPVGGGCRKSKRSSNTKTKTTTSTSETTSSQQQTPEQKSNSHSSSESSSLTAATTTTTTTTAAVTELNSDSSNNHPHDSKLLIPSSNPGLESSGGPLDQGAGDCGGIFSEIGTFSSLIASSSSNNDALASFGFGSGGVTDAASFQWQHQKINDSLSGNLLDHHGHGSASITVDLSALQGKTGNGGFGPLDWQGGADQGLFDLPNAVDQAYWSQTQWPDQDNSALFHLP